MCPNISKEDAAVVLQSYTSTCEIPEHQYVGKKYFKQSHK